MEGSPSLRTFDAARFYELMVISTPDGDPEDLVAASERVGNHISASGGVLLRANSDSPWGRRRLAYPIRHSSQDLRDGFYTLYHFQAEPGMIEAIERELHLDERVMRHLVLQLAREPIFAEPEAVDEESTAVEGEDERTAAIAGMPEVAEDAQTPEPTGTIAQTVTEDLSADNVAASPQVVGPGVGEDIEGPEVAEVTNSEE
jgi:small subunit ribosomal protein S6